MSDQLEIALKSRALNHNATLVWTVMAPTTGATFGEWWSQEAVVERIAARFGVLMNTHALNARLSELRTVGHYQVDKRRSSTGRAYEYRVSARPVA